MATVLYDRLRERCFFAALFAFSSFIFPQPASGSPWTRDNDEAMVITRADYFSAEIRNISVGGISVDGRFERLESNTYIEYGLTDRLMIGGKALYGQSWLTRGGFVETERGFTEIELFAQRQIFRTPRHAGAVKIAAGVPTGVVSGARTSLNTNSTDLEISALYGRSLTFKPVKTFAAVELGMRRRFGEAADQLRLLTTIGIEPSRRLGFLLDTYSTKSLGNEDPGGADFDVFKLQPSLVWKATRRFSFQIGVTKEIAGRNLDLGTTYFIGLRTRL